MNVYNDLNNLPNFTNAVVTIGSFDGVHLGHRQLLSKIKSLAKSINGEDVVVTFHPHPRSIIKQKDYSLQLLNELEEKLNLLKSFGIANCVIVPFTLDFSRQSPTEYIEHFIIKSLCPKILVVGYDHKFGFNRKGDFNLLERYAKGGSFELFKIEKEEIDNIAISSTKIRNNLNSGNVSKANSYLSYEYFITGIVTKGQQIGSTLGYPTANIKVKLNNKLIPKVGIYSCSVLINNISYFGMAYIGQRPSIQDDNIVRIEVNIFDFDLNIYDKLVQVSFINRIRDDIKFSNLDELKIQLGRDKREVLDDLKNRICNFDNQESNYLEASKIVNSEVNIAVVILNYNGEKVLDQFLSSLYSSSNKYNYDLIVIDNGSSDNSVQYLIDNHPKVKIIELPNNLGFAGGYNEGLKNLEYTHFALVNSDIEGTVNWLDPIIERLVAMPSVAIAQPKIRAYNNRDYFEYAGASGGYIDQLGYPYCRGRIFTTIEKDHSQYDNICDIDWATGAALIIKAEVYKKVKGFDADYFAHMEEIDLCIRVKRLGYKIEVIPESLVYHLGGGTLAYESPRKTYLNFRNNLATIIKNYTLAQLIIVFPVRLILDGVAGIKFLSEGNIQNTIAIIKAHFSTYANFITLIRKRNRLKLFYQKNGLDGKLYFTHNIKSILYQYYLLGRKKFSDLLL